MSTKLRTVNRGRRTTVIGQNTSEGNPFEKVIFGILLTLTVLTPIAFLPNGADITGIAKVTVVRILALSIILAWTLSMAVRGKERRPSGRSAITLTVFAAILIISTFFSTDFSVSLYGRHLGYLGLLTYLAFFVIAFAGWWVLRDSKRRYTLLFTMAATASVVSFIAILQSLGIFSNIWDIGPLFGTRGYSTLGNPDFLGLYLAVALGAALAGVTGSKDQLRRVLSGLFVLFIIGGVASSGSAGAIVGASIAATVFLAILLFTSGRKAIAGLSVGAVLIIGTILALVLVPQLKGDSLTLRLLLWPAALEVAAERPVLGTGLDALQYHLPPKMDIIEGDHNRFTPEDAHNYFLTLGASAGIPALMVFLVLMWSTWSGRGNSSGSIWATKAGVVAGMAGYLGAAAFNPDDIAAAAMFWMLVGWCGGSDDSVQTLELPTVGRIAAGASAVVIVPLLALAVLPAAADITYESAQRAQNLQQAVQRLERTTELAPYDEWYRRRLSGVYVEQLSSGNLNFTDVAADSTLTGITLAPLEANSFVLAGLADYFQAVYLTPSPERDVLRDRARFKLERALKLHPTNPDGLYYLFLLAADEDEGTAMTLAERYLELGLADPRTAEMRSYVDQRAS